MLASTAVAILAATFGPGERGKALGINAASLYTGLSLGPAIGGILTQSFGWRAVFLVNIPLGVALFLAAYLKLPAQKPDAADISFDWSGFTAYAVFLSSSVYGLTQLPSGRALISIAIGVGAFLILLRLEKVSRHPLVDTALFRHNLPFAMSNIAAFLNYSSFYAATFLLSIYLQVATGLSPRTAGLVLVSMPVIQAFVSPLSGRLSDRVEPRFLASGGMALATGALFAMSRLDTVSPVVMVVLALALLGLGVGIFSSPNTNAVMASVDSTQYGVAAATLSTTRQVGMVLSMGIATLFIASQIGTSDVSTASPHLFVSAMQSTFALCTAACAVGIIASLARGSVYREKLHRPGAEE